MCFKILSNIKVTDSFFWTCTMQFAVSTLQKYSFAQIFLTFFCHIITSIPTLGLTLTKLTHSIPLILTSRA